MHCFYPICLVVLLLGVVHQNAKALSTLRGLRGAPEVPPLCRETQSLGQQMLKEPLGINGLLGCREEPTRLRRHFPIARYAELPEDACVQSTYISTYIYIQSTIYIHWNIFTKMTSYY